VREKIPIRGIHRLPDAVQIRLPFYSRWTRRLTSLGGLSRRADSGQRKDANDDDNGGC